MLKQRLYSVAWDWDSEQQWTYQIWYDKYHCNSTGLAASCRTSAKRTPSTQIVIGSTSRISHIFVCVSLLKDILLKCSLKRACIVNRALKEPTLLEWK